jgi:hypothetical protein
MVIRHRPHWPRCDSFVPCEGELSALSCCVAGFSRDRARGATWGDRVIGGWYELNYHLTMRHVNDSSEEEMVAHFLAAEFRSGRFGAAIMEHLRLDGMPDRIVIVPDVTSVRENAYRRHLLGAYRGFGKDAELFHGFPTVVQWRWKALCREELRKIRYINYGYWVELSGGSRFPSDAAERITAGIEAYCVSNQGIMAAAAHVGGGGTFPELIVVSTAEDGDLVVLEGHVRLTAYMLQPLALPSELKLLVGFPPEFADWPLY